MRCALEALEKIEATFDGVFVRWDDEVLSGRNLKGDAETEQNSQAEDRLYGKTGKGS